MKYCLILLIASLLAVVPVAAHDCYGHPHHAMGGHDCPGCARAGWNAQPASAPAETLQGTVSEIRRPPVAAGVVEAWLKTSAGAVLVRLAPADYLRQNGLTLAEGAHLTVKGYRAASSDGDVLIAAEAAGGGKTVLLRNGRGQPLW